MKYYFMLLSIILCFSIFSVTTNADELTQNLNNSSAVVMAEVAISSMDNEKPSTDVDTGDYEGKLNFYTELGDF